MKTIDRMQTNWLLASEINKLEARVWSMSRREGLKTILFTSALRGEGKSTTVAHLATALGMYPDRRILAMDFDFRIPAMNQHFELSGFTGIDRVLQGKASIDEAIIRTELPSLDVTLPTEGGADPALLLRTRDLVSLLDSLRDRYDLILIDSPAIVPVADATMLLPVTDGVILAGMAGRSTESQLKRARQICESVDARVVGLVVSNVEEAAPEYTAYQNNYEGYQQAAPVPAGADPASAPDSGGRRSKNPLRRREGR